MKHYDAGGAPLGDPFKAARGGARASANQLRTVASIFAEMGDPDAAERATAIANDLEKLSTQIDTLEPTVDALLEPFVTKRNAENKARNEAREKKEQDDRLRLLKTMTVDNVECPAVPGALRFRKL